MNRFFENKKFRYGSVSVALTVVIIAAVILVNAIFTALGNKYQWRIDMTENKIFTLSDGAKDLLSQIPKGADGKPREATILFCAEPDVLEENAVTRYVLDTANDIHKAFPHVTVKNVDIYTNPSAVSAYKAPSGQTINSQSVIITSGTEFRVYSIDQLYTYDSEGSTIVGYNGEQRLVSALLAVTQAESPIACYTTNHGETDAFTADSSILRLLYEVGYEVEEIDLQKGDFPADCRLLLLFDPQDDFSSRELKKIDAFLDEFNSMMVFFDYDTPVLTRLEEFLAEWGIAIARDENKANYLIRDNGNALDTERFEILADYVEDEHIGGDVTKHMRKSTTPKSVVFPHTGAIKSTFRREDVEGSGPYYTDDASYNSRKQYPIFVSSDEAEAIAGELPVTTKDYNNYPFNLMTLTRDTVQRGDEYYYTNVLACASTEFASAQFLDSAYGNHAVLAYMSSVMSRAIIPVSLDCKYFTDLEINSITAQDANQYMLVLTLVPAGIIFAAGIYIMVRRKYA